MPFPVCGAINGGAAGFIHFLKLILFPLLRFIPRFFARPFIFPARSAAHCMDVKNNEIRGKSLIKAFVYGLFCLTNLPAGAIIINDKIITII